MPAGGFTDTAYIVIPWHEGEPSVAAVLLNRTPLSVAKIQSKPTQFHSLLQLQCNVKNI